MINYWFEPRPCLRPGGCSLITWLLWPSLCLAIFAPFWQLICNFIVTNNYWFETTPCLRPGVVYYMLHLSVHMRARDVPFSKGSNCYQKMANHFMPSRMTATLFLLVVEKWKPVNFSSSMMTIIFMALCTRPVLMLISTIKIILHLLYTSSVWYILHVIQLHWLFLYLHYKFLNRCLATCGFLCSVILG